MSRRYPLLIVLTLLVVLACAYSTYMAFQFSGLPFNGVLVNSRTAVVKPISGIPLPPGMQAGDQIDLPASSPAARSVLLPDMLDVGTVTEGRTYDFAINKDGKFVTLPVTSVNLAAGKGVWLNAWAISWFSMAISVIALLLLWRGRDRAARGMALWAVGTLIGFTFSETHGNDVTVSALIHAANICWLLSRAGFYVTIESMLGGALTLRRRTLFRWIFVLVLLAGVVQQLGGVLIFVASGWGELLRPAYGLIFTASYVVPVIMLFISYGTADAAQRLRLRWIVWSSAILLIAVGISNTPVPLLGPIATNISSRALALVTSVGFLYAVLRHRVVNVSVFIDRTLVYGSVTALVVGVLAAVNTIAQHAALGSNASLLLQIIVPLALGIVLGQVRSYADKIVERVFFRYKYLAEKALRLFAQSCTGYEDSGELLTATVRNIHRGINATAVAIYQRDDTQYRVTNYAGSADYLQTAAVDDEAFAAVRSGQENIDLSELHSAIGTNGLVFATGRQAVLVCANRPGEHYSTDERKLLRYIAFQVGTALDALHMQEAMKRLEAKASLVDAVLKGALPASAKLKARARELASISVVG